MLGKRETKGILPFTAANQDGHGREERQRQDYDRQIAMITDVSDRHDVRQKETNSVLGGVSGVFREYARLPVSCVDGEEFGDPRPTGAAFPSRRRPFPRSGRHESHR